MQVHLLGTAAGGGFPQWNCNCSNCRVAREDPRLARPRTQSCTAISSDGQLWFLLNASPDIARQIATHPFLNPPDNVARGSPIAGVLLTNADLDHTLGLFNLREGGPLAIHASEPVRKSLSAGLNIERIFSAYCGIEWHIPPAQPAPLCYPDGSRNGLTYSAFTVPGKPPRYRSTSQASPGDCVGYRFVDNRTGGRLIFLPELAAINERIASEIANADLLLLDGTFFDDDDMRKAGVGTATAAEMGHMPVGGISGSLARIADLKHVVRVYVHINNTNPMLLENSPQRAAVEAVGVQIGFDGMRFDI